MADKLTGSEDAARMSDIALPAADARRRIDWDALWPPGTTAFTIRTFLALVISLYLGFVLELDGASSAAVCVLILAQPSQGMVLSKALYRLIGTLVGCIVAVAITALFPQDRTMLLAAFTLFMAVETALGSLLRDFRSYGSILAGYTVAIISVANIDAPTMAFESAVNRVAAIILGIVAIAAVNLFFVGAASSRALMARMRAVTSDMLGAAHAAIDGVVPTTAQCVAIATRLMALRGETTHAAPETPGGRFRADGARSALLALFDLINATNAVAVGMQHLTTASPIIEDAKALARRALRLQHPQVCAAELDAMIEAATAAETLSLPDAFVLDRLRFMIDALADLRDGLRALRTARKPRRRVRLPVHQDYVAVVLNAVRVIVAVGFVATLSVLSGWTNTAQVVLFTAVFVSLGSVQADPGVLGRTAIFGLPVVILIGTIYAFFIFPNIDGFPLFALSLLPIVAATCWLVQKGLAGAGLIVGTQTIVLIGPANVQVLDPDTFVSTATTLLLSGIAIFASVMLVLPVDPAQRRLRLALAVGDDLRRALAGRMQWRQSQASRFYDRLSQFKTWQGDEAVTLARRKTARRIVELGQLAQAVQRAWTSLERARGDVDPALDAEARSRLPKLAPAAIGDMAQLYLAAARGHRGQPVLRLVHAAGALYGTALLTTSEARLLRRIRLLGRWP